MMIEAKIKRDMAILAAKKQPYTSTEIRELTRPTEAQRLGAKLRELRLLELHLASYNATYNRHSVIEGLAEEIHNLEKQV